MTNQELPDEVNRAIGLLSSLKNILDEILQCWHVSLQASQMATQPAVNPVTQALDNTGTLRAAANLKQENPEKFSGEPKMLLNFLFEVEQLCNMIGVDKVYESVKLAVTFLSGRTLTWWRSIAAKPQATLGQCNWVMFKARLTMAFQDANHLLRIRQRMVTLQQYTSVQAYNAEFRGLLLEIRATMSEQDILFLYLTGLKINVQYQVMLHSPSMVERAMELADHADASFWFASRQSQPQPKQGQGRGWPGASGGSQPMGNPGRNGGRGPIPIELGAAQNPRGQWPKGQPYQPAQ